MSIIATLRRKTADPRPAPSVAGTWFNIRLTPDLAADERVNIGVGFVNPDGTVLTKLLTRFDRLRCLYDDRLDIRDLEFLVQCLEFDASLRSPGPNITFSRPAYASGTSAESILQELYDEMVTLEPTARADRDAKETARGIDTPTARRLVCDAMARKHPLSAALWAEDPNWRVSDGVLDMPIRTPGRFATLVSVWGKSRYSIEWQTLRAQVELTTALGLHPRDTAGLFVLRPPPNAPGYTEALHEQIDNVIDMTAWRLKIRDTRLDVADSPDALADCVLRWAEIA